MSTRRYVRPPWAARVVGSRLARLFRPSIVGRLSVVRRTSGQRQSVSVAVLRYDGQEYLVAAYGDTEWSRNLRAAGRGQLTRSGRTQQFSVVEIPVGERPPLLSAYRREFGKRPTVERTFHALPDPADHPVFLIRSLDRLPGHGR
ncbi:MAG: deazaflavin-dependent nitroreductase [Actinomycetota bacterium]|nr:MAG: deazaflavin-dependent nitroreductase [Actinomycetota bacterium]